MLLDENPNYNKISDQIVEFILKDDSQFEQLKSQHPPPPSLKTENNITYQTKMSIFNNDQRIENILERCKKLFN